MNYAIVTAAGKGARFGSNKALYVLKDKPILIWSLLPFERNAAIEKIIVTTPAGESDQSYRQVCSAENLKKVSFLAGGETRFDSVRNAFLSIRCSDQDVVLIHDAARPLLSTQLLNRVLDAALAHGSALPVISIAETVKEVEKEQVVRTISRERLFLAQTPQGFRARILADAYSKIKEQNITDEAMLVELAGYSIHIVPGERENLKITDPQDIKIAGSLL